MKLEVGMYCYIKNFREYGIGIIDCILDNNLCVIDCQHNAHTVSCDNVIASHNIIDLIEVGDYVNGELVSDITGEYFRIGDVSHNKPWLSNNIKTILTHEQFENNCFRIGD